MGLCAPRPVSFGPEEERQRAELYIKNVMKERAGEEDNPAADTEVSAGEDLPDWVDFDGGTQKTYQRMIEAMDRQIGRVLQALHANGLTENTIVIFTRDNGGERFADTWPFTGARVVRLERNDAAGNPGKLHGRVQRKASG